MEQVGAEWYERAPRTDCAPWTFAAGEVYTVVSFHGPTTGQMAGMRGITAATPGFDFGQHVNFYLSYVCDDGRSHYTNAFSTQTLDAVPPYLDRFEMLRMGLNSGAPRGPPTLSDHAKVALLTLVLWVSTSSIAGKLASFIPFVFLGVLLRWWIQVQRTRHLRCCTACCSLYFTTLVFAVMLLVSLFVSLRLPDTPFGNTKAEQEALKSTDSFKARQADAAAATLTLIMLSFTMIALDLVWILRNLITGHQNGVRVATKDDEDGSSCLPLVKLKSPLL